MSAMAMRLLSTTRALGRATSVPCPGSSLARSTRSFSSSSSNSTSHRLVRPSTPKSRSIAPPAHVQSQRRQMSALSDHSIYSDDDTPPPVAIKSVSPSSIELVDGLVLSQPCIFLSGRVFLWECPPVTQHGVWPGWTVEHFKLFEVVVPRPEILLLGTGDQSMMPPPSVKAYLNELGIQLDVMNTWNACSTYNLLAEEGRRVATALLPSSTHHGSWHAQAPPST